MEVPLREIQFRGLRSDRDFFMKETRLIDGSLQNEIADLKPIGCFQEGLSGRIFDEDADNGHLQSAPGGRRHVANEYLIRVFHCLIAL